MDAVQIPKYSSDNLTNSLNDCVSVQ